MAEPPMEHGVFDSSDEEADWQIAGYLPLEADNYRDDYVNFDPESSGRDMDFEVKGWSGNDFLAEADYVVVHVWSGGDDYYVTLGGPFDGIDDVWDAIHEWWEEGS